MTGYNILGQAVDITNPETLPIGMYFVSPEDSPVNCGSLQPVMIVAHHGVDSNGNATGVSYACNGSTTQVHEPDIYLVDDDWKHYIKYTLIIALIILSISIVKKLV